METSRKQKRVVIIKITTRFCYYKLAEKVRFELTVLAYTRVPGVHLKPLGHLSLLCVSRRPAGRSLRPWSLYLYCKRVFYNRKRPSVLKKIPQHLAAFFGQNAAGNREMMVEETVAANAVF